MTSAPLQWYEDEDAFARELARGRRGEILIASRLLPLGLWIRINRPRLRTDIADRSDFYSDIDIEVEGGHLLEVKYRNFAFTSPDDFPFDTVFLGAERRWEERTTKPCALVITSEPTGEAVIVPGASEPRWLTAPARDGVRGFTDQTRQAPREVLLSWQRLISHLERSHQ